MNRKDPSPSGRLGTPARSHGSPSLSNLGALQKPEQPQMTPHSPEAGADDPFDDDLCTLSSQDKTVVTIMLVLGIVMQAGANQSFGAVVVALLLLVAGMIIVNTAFPRKGPEMRGFLMTFSVSVFAAGLAQCYSLAYFDTLQSTIDAKKFLRCIISGESLTELAKRHINSPLAIVVWQQAYKVTGWLGFGSGPYTGVMFNGCLMGLAGSLIVQIAREIFGPDNRRLRLVGSLVAANGLFILFGAVLIRDAFLTFVSTLVLWSIIRWLNRQTSLDLLVSIALTGASAWPLYYLREEQVMLLPLYWLLAFFLWWYARMDAIGFVLGIIVLFAMLAMGGTVAQYAENSTEVRAREQSKYDGFTAERSAEGSLGKQFISDAPMPIRHVFGSLSQMILPMPLWSYFNTRSLDYHWIKGYNGIYQVLLMPLVFGGVFTVLRMFKRDRRRALPAMFLLVYFLLNWQGVIATSMEQRHFGQFLGAILVLAGFSCSNDPRTRGEILRISGGMVFGCVSCAFGMAHIEDDVV